MSGDGQEGLADTELSDPLVVRATRETPSGRSVPAVGALVNFNVLEGAGTMFAGSVVTNDQGLARDYWTLGPRPGSNVVEVRAVDPSSGAKRVYGQFEATGLAPRRAYVGFDGDDFVAVIDLVSHEVIKYVPGNAQDVAVTPDGSAAYAATFAGGGVSVIDTHTNIVTETLVLDLFRPLLIEISPDGTTAYVADRSGRDFAVIDLATNGVELLAVGESGERAEGLAVSPDGATVWLGRANDDASLPGNVYVIDAETHSVITALEAGRPIGIAFSPDGSTAYVTDRHADEVLVIDVATLVPVESIPVEEGVGMIVVTPDGSTAYAAGDDIVSVIDLATNSVTGTIPVDGGSSEGLAISPDGLTLYVTNLGVPGISVIDLATNAVVTTVEVAGELPVSIAVTPH